MCEWWVTFSNVELETRLTASMIAGISSLHGEE